MKRMIPISVSIWVICIFLIGCSGKTFDSKKVVDYDVKHSETEVEEGDFIFRLVSAKEIYQVGEEVELYAEVIYTGNEPSVTIEHASEAVIFPMQEKVRNYEISAGVNDIALSTKLEQEKPYKVVYSKSGVGYGDEDPADYQAFVKKILNREGFPAGYYEVNGETDFYLQQEHIQMEAEIDFKVIE